MKTTVAKPVKSSNAGTKKFQIDCLPFIFSIEELEVLEKKGHVLKALSEGKKNPVSSEEKSFIKVCMGEANPLSTMETAWMKYRNRHQIEAALFCNEELYKEYLRIRKH